MELSAPARLCFRAAVALLWCAAAAAQNTPAIAFDGVVNNANYLPSCATNGGIAPGALFAVFGRDLGPATLVRASSFPLQTSLAGVSVRVVAAGGAAFDAWPLYASANQLGAVLPSNVPPGDASVIVSYQGRASTPAAVRVRRAAFGLFTTNQRGNGPAVIENVDPSGVTSLNTSARPLGSAQLAVIWGAGLGAVPGDEAAGPVPGDRTALDVRVWIGDRTARVVYRGRSGCCAGIDQVVFETPTGVEGCQVPVAVEVDGVLSNFGSIAIAGPSGTCNAVARPAPIPSSRPDFRAAVIVFLDGFGSVLLPTALEDWLRMAFFRSGAIDGNVEPTLWAFEPNAEVPPGTCSVRTGTDFPPQPAPQPGGLDAGAEVRVTGPGGVFRLTPSRVNGNYEDARRVPLPAGRYRVDNGAGGADVGPFSFETDALTLKLTGVPDRIPRGRDLALTWDYDGPAGHTLTIYGASRGACGQERTSFACVVPAGARRFTVPARILSQLPPSTQIFGIPDGALNISTTNPGGLRRFSAPGLDLGVFIHISISAVRPFWE